MRNKSAIDNMCKIYTVYLLCYCYIIIMMVTIGKQKVMTRINISDEETELHLSYS